MFLRWVSDGYNFFMEAFAITAARNFARVVLIRAENTMTHPGLLGARRPVTQPRRYASLRKLGRLEWEAGMGDKEEQF